MRSISRQTENKIIKNVRDYMGKESGYNFSIEVWFMLISNLRDDLNICIKQSVYQNIRL